MSFSVVASTNIIVGFDATFVTDSSGTVALGGTPLLADLETIAPLAAQMDGQAEMLADGVGLAMGAAQMDGQTQVEVISPSAPGVAQMDGQAQVLIDSRALFMGAARMDGQAQVVAASANMAPGIAQMDGRASTVVMQSVPGAGLTEMDGEASMLAVSPNIHRVNLLENIIGGEATSLLNSYNYVLSQGITGSELIKASARYRVTAQSSVSLAHTISYKMRFPKLLREIIVTLTGDLEPHLYYHYVFTSSVGMRPTLSPDFTAVISLVENLLIDLTTNQGSIWGRTLRQAFRTSAAVAVHGQYKTSLAHLIKFIESEGFILRHPIALSQDINLSPLLVGGISLKLLQKLLVATSSLPGFNYHLMLTNRVRLGDTLEHLVREVLAQLFTVHSTVDRQFIADNSLAQLLTVHPALNTKLILRIAGNLAVSPSQLVSMIYAGDPLLDEVVITALYISPSGTTTTWAVNTRTNAVTEYLNYDFRSFASMGNRYIAAGSDGLYELDGDTDDGELIISRMMSGYLQFEKKLFGVKGAYVAIRGGGRFYLKLISGDGREYIYELRAQPNLMTTKVKVGKGIRTTYMAFELITEGQDFDLDSLEFIPMMSGRRV